MGREVAWGWSWGGREEGVEQQDGQGEAAEEKDVAARLLYLLILSWWGWWSLHIVSVV